MAEPTFFGGTTGLTFEELQRRKAIALALAQRGTPVRDMASGMTAFGEGVGSLIGDWRLREMEKARKAELADEEKKVEKGTEDPPSTPRSPAATSAVDPPIEDPPTRTAYAPEVDPNMVMETPAARPAMTPPPGPTNVPMPQPRPPASTRNFPSPQEQMPQITAQLPGSPNVSSRWPITDNEVQPGPAGAVWPPQTEPNLSWPQPRLQAAEVVPPPDETPIQARPVSTTDVPPSMRNLMSPQRGQPTPQRLDATMQPPLPAPAPPPAPVQAPAPVPQDSVNRLEVRPTAASLAPPGGGGGVDGLRGARRFGIAGIESGGAKDPYSLLGSITKSGDRAYGKYQIMGKNIPEWTRNALGVSMTPKQFLANKQAQEDTFDHRMDMYAKKYGEEGAARAWYAGEPGMNKLGRRDMHGRLNVAGYRDDYMNRFAAYDPNNPAAGSPAGSPQVAAGSPQPAGGSRDDITAALMDVPITIPKDTPPEDAQLYNQNLPSQKLPAKGVSYAPTAALAPQNVASDAPLPGMQPLGSPGMNAGNDPRAAIAAKLLEQQGQTAPEVPQMDPTQAGATPPAPAPTSLPSMPSPGSSQTMTDIPPAPPIGGPGDVLAQAGPAPASPPPRAAGAGNGVTVPPSYDTPRPPAIIEQVPPYSRPMPVLGPAPVKPEPSDPAKRALEWRMKHPGETDVEARADAIIAREWAKQEPKFNADMKEWEARKAGYPKLLEDWHKSREEEQQRKDEAAKRAYELAAQAEEQKERANWGGLSKETRTGLLKSRDNAREAVGTITAFNDAEEVLKAGVIAGPGSWAKLQAYRIAAAAGNAEANRIVANSEAFATSMLPTIAAQIKSYTGPGITNDDRQWATKMLGGNVEQTQANLERLINIGRRSAEAKIADHKRDVESSTYGVDPKVVERFSAGEPKPGMPAFPPKDGGAEAKPKYEEGREAVDASGNVVVRRGGKWVPK